MYRLRLFGTPLVEGPEGPVSGRVTQRRRLALLAVLALADRRVVSRDKLLAMFWPESTPERARHSLADTVYVVRKALGDDALISAGDDLVLAPDRVSTDVEAFEESLAEGDLEEAVEQYAAPLLDGFHVGGAPGFERWLQVERARLAADHAGALERLAARAAARGDRAGAAAWWRRRWAVEPLNTRVAMELMRALAEEGNRGAAIRHGRLHARALREELGVEPGPELAELEREIRSGGVGVEASRPVLRTRPHRSPPAMEGRGSGGPGDARSAPRAPSPSPSSPPSSPSRASRRGGPPVLRWAAAAALGGALLAAGLAGGVLDPTPARVPDRIVVAPFADRTGDPRLEQFGFLAAEVLIHGLKRAEVGDVVLPLELRAAAEARREDPGADRPLEAAAAVREFRAGLAVSGTVHRDGDSVVFLARVVEGGGGSIVSVPEPVRGPVSDPGRALERLRERVVGAVASHLGRSLPEHPFVVRTPTWESYRAADLATRHFLRRDFAQAARAYRRAYALDTTAVGYLLWEAISHSNLGDFEAVTRILDRLRPRRRELSRFDAAQFDWLEAVASGDRMGALRGARVAREEAPHSGLGGYQLAVELARTGRPGEAVEILRSLDPDRGWLRSWGRYWYRLATYHHLLGDHEAELEAAERGYERHPTGWMLDARLRALAALGRVGELESLLQTSAPGPSRHLAAARALHRHGRPAEAKRVAQRGLLSLRAADPGPAGRERLERLFLEARLLVASGRPAEARPLLEELAEALPEEPRCLGWLGYVEARLGHEVPARAVLGRLQALEGTPYLRGSHTAWRAAVLAELGEDPRRVRRLLERARRQGMAFPPFHFTPLFDPVRRHPAVEDFFRPRG